ncbi:MAG: M15 family metallopeptidase [Lachnospiraceae bacterium]
MKKRKKNKKRQLLIFLYLFIAFLLGILIGLFIGAKSAGRKPAVSSSVNPSSVMNDEKPLAAKLSTLPWNLTLVNYAYSLDRSYEPPKLVTLTGKYQVDSRILDDAKAMLAAAKKDKVSLVVVSAYRDFEKQNELYDNKTQRLLSANKYSLEEAREEAAHTVAVPGTSEHQLGLALDIVDASYQKLDEKQEETAGYQWLTEHCTEYGFIVRYPKDKTDITGIIYEPWHFRYVGRDIAKEITDLGICLEEYIADMK